MKVSRITTTQPRLQWLRRDKYEEFVSSIIDPRISNGVIMQEAIEEVKDKLAGYASGKTTAKGYSVHIRTFLRTVAKLYGSGLAEALNNKATRTLSEDDF